MVPNPICPTHGVEMKESKFGGYHCTRKDGESFCSQKSGKGNALPQLRTGAELMLEQRGWVAANNDARVSSALEFAGRVYQGTAGESEQAALQLAERALLMFERKS